MSHANAPSPPPPLAELTKNSGQWALFLDFDGTLVDLAPTPDAITVPPDLPGLLEGLSTCFNGALAIMTGRALADLDRHLGGLRLRAVGQHGAECRIDPAQHERAEPALILDAARRKIREFAMAHPGVLVEDKGAAIAVHFRGAPHVEAQATTLVTRIADESEGALDVMPGKAVCELRPAGKDKGVALRSLLGIPPFRGRWPLVLGDDVTDEAAFAAALSASGSAVKVGCGETCAPWRLASPSEARRWLAGGM